MITLDFLRLGFPFINKNPQLPPFIHTRCLSSLTEQRVLHGQRPQDGSLVSVNCGLPHVLTSTQYSFIFFSDRPDDSTVSFRASRFSARQAKAFPVTFCSFCCWSTGVRHSPEKVQKGTGVIWAGEFSRVRLASGRSETKMKLC